MAENTEKLEAAENSKASELESLKETADLFMELSQEMAAAGNQDMARYYSEKAKKFTEAAEPGQEKKLGAWAGYTGSEWREMAAKEYAKNGDSQNYRRYCENATKA